MRNPFTVLSDSDSENRVDSEVEVSSKVDNYTPHLTSKNNGKPNKPLDGAIWQAGRGQTFPFWVH